MSANGFPEQIDLTRGSSTVASWIDARQHRPRETHTPNRGFSHARPPSRPPPLLGRNRALYRLFDRIAALRLRLGARDRAALRLGPGPRRGNAEDHSRPDRRARRSAGAERARRPMAERRRPFLELPARRDLPE